MEEWRDVKGFEGIYQVSSEGRVRSLDRIDNSGHFRKGFIKSLTKKKTGYLVTALYNDNKYTHIGVHRLVAQAFIPNPNNYPIVKHKDENKQNNMIWVNEDGSIDYNKSNLEWCTIDYNNNYGTRTERAAKKNSEVQKGKERPNRYKKVAKCDNKGNIIITYNSIKEAAKSIDKPSSYISTCLIGKTKTCNGFIWKYVA